MSWLKFRKQDGYVVSIHGEQPLDLTEDFDMIQTDNFNPGDEFKYFITVLDKESQAIASIQQSLPTIDILQRIDKIEKVIGIDQSERKRIIQKIDAIESEILKIKQYFNII